MSGSVVSRLTRRAAPAAAATTGLLLAAGALALPASAVQPVAGEEVLRAKVTSGYQFYECVAGEYEFVRPAAYLEGTGDDRGVLVFHHVVVTDEGLIPTWDVVWSGKDDSKIQVSEVVESAESPNGPGSIPELSLLVTQIGGEGRLDGVDVVQRLDTVGGVAPERACSDGEEEKVAYEAEYVFIDTDV